tara:strand:+ start:626 stop:1270 length:645 start_codon:yes stop_codon:yes gene_type:complete
MRVKINKGGKQKKFKLIDKWSDVTLENWIKLVESKSSRKTQEARKTIAALSTIPAELIDQLSLSDVAIIMQKVSELQQGDDAAFRRLITIDKKEYGFHPNLDDITLGEYADLETFIRSDIQKSLPEVMAILYRPVTEKGDNGVYTIEAYDGNIRIRAEQMKKMSAEEVHNALVFFYLLGREFLASMPSVLMDRLVETKMQSQQNHSQKSGDGSE